MDVQVCFKRITYAENDVQKLFENDTSVYKTEQVWGWQRRQQKIIKRNVKTVWVYENSATSAID